MPLTPIQARHIRRYTQAVLSVRLGNAVATAHPAAAPDAVRQAAERVAARAQGRPVLLAGLGDGALPLALHACMPDTPLIIVELEPENARLALAGPAGNIFGGISGDLPGAPDWAATRALLTDTSGWALALLLFQIGLGPDVCAVELNPFAESGARRKFLHWKTLFTGCAPLVLPLSGPQPDLALAAILHPDDAGLEGFFRQIPPWLARAAVVWDAAEVPEQGRAAAAACAVPVLHAARPLAGDFSAQRNAALHLVSQDWVLFLDADERLEEDTWNRLPALMAMPFAAWAFPRLTLYPDAAHARAGYGLWPDVQMRLLRNSPRLHFERPVHEVARGVDGRAGLLLAGSIRHESWLLKKRAAQAERLAVFNSAAGRETHRLSAEYPALEAEFFISLNGLSLAPPALALPGAVE